MSVLAKNQWRVLAVSTALLFAYSFVLAKLARDWWADDNYSHGLLVPFIIGYILWSQRERFARQTSRPATFWGGGLVLLSLAGLWAGVAGAELYLQRLSLVSIIAGVAIYLWGFSFLRLLLVPLALLLLALPIPAILLNRIAFPLQLFASRCAVWSMGLFGIPVLREGNVIELLPLNARETTKLEVVEACSGIRSLMTLVTLAFVFAYFTHPRPKNPNGPRSRFGWLGSYGFWRSAIIVGSAVPIAIFTNALRVSGTGVLSHYYGTAVADGFFHSFSGWAIYIVAFLLMFAVGWLLDRLSGSGRREVEAGASSEVSGEKPISVNTATPIARAEGAE